MFDPNHQLNTHEGTLPNTEPQAPRAISIDEADNQVGRNNAPYNPGGEGHGGSDAVTKD